jgi:hypothetical protein
MEHANFVRMTAKGGTEVIRLPKTQVKKPFDDSFKWTKEIERKRKSDVSFLYLRDDTAILLQTLLKFWLELQYQCKYSIL